MVDRDGGRWLWTETLVIVDRDGGSGRRRGEQKRCLWTETETMVDKDGDSGC